MRTSVVSDERESPRATARRIGVNGLFLALGKMAGMETYLRCLMREMPLLDPETAYSLFTERNNAGSFGIGAYLNAREVICRIPPVANRRAMWASRLAYEYTRLPAQARRQKVDVLFSPAFIGPARPHYASVITIHDTQHEDCPENFGSLDRALFTRLIRQSVRSASQILTVSEYTKRRIEAVYGVSPERITVTPNAPDAAYSRRVPAGEVARVVGAYGIRVPYILSVATLLPHKNLDTLIAAYAALRQHGATHAQLVLVGLRSVAAGSIEEKVRAAGLGGEVVVTGWVPDADLPALYQGAAMFVLPSRYEGFGLPVLEAMASGVAVVTTTATALPEVAGEAALLVEPDDVAGLADVLRRVLDDSVLRAGMVARGRERAAQFTWRKTAELTLATLLRVSEDRPPRIGARMTAR
ncbi:MAG: glycosyltransferase family 4 protein [Chloroflexota bacterium]|nr:glycosyltransferase family 4 protein [Chloroflexota bacterium]